MIEKELKEMETEQKQIEIVQNGLLKSKVQFESTIQKVESKLEQTLSWELDSADVPPIDYTDFTVPIKS